MSATNQMITRCPKCGTAFRMTATQLQSAKGAVRCGSCLHVFKAQDYLVATSSPNTNSAPGSNADAHLSSSPSSLSTKEPEPKIAPTGKHETEKLDTAKPADSNFSPTLSSTKPLSADQAAVTTASTTINTTPKNDINTLSKPVIRVINKASLVEQDDLLISDDMDSQQTDSNSYEFDGFMDINIKPKSDVSLFERKKRVIEPEETAINTDESWAEMLIEDEEEDFAKLEVSRPSASHAKTEEQLADDELIESQAIDTSLQNPDSPAKPTPKSAPGLIFSLVGEKEVGTDEDIILSDELARIPSHQGFTAPANSDMPDPSLFEEPKQQEDESPKRQVKTQPKIRAYDGSRTALLMNIMPAPIEFSAKRMRHWYQRKLWPSLSILGLIALAVQVAWFKFDYFSRAEPYRTGYLFLCPYIGCQVPTLVDTSQIIASNLVVREHPETLGALAVDVMLINGAPFEQPFPDLVLVFTDIDENQVASRRFTPKDYLGGELVGRELMPQNQKIHITLDLVDPGAEAVNYHIYIPRQ
jgi:predicted Zn finger-like uncharacterized protein